MMQKLVTDSKQQRILAKQSRSLQHQPTGHIDCACVIHGRAYGWEYVENLYAMLQRNSQYAVRMHVFTELDRPVPPHMIKHVLTEWTGVAGPKKSWWYKMQMFDPGHFAGRLLYFDLDVVLTGDIDWAWQLDANRFWTIRDFRYIWRQGYRGVNSSMMLWDTRRYEHIWQDFQGRNIQAVIKQFHGDQDFLTSVLREKDLGFFDENLVKSYRWQIKDGGFDMKRRVYARPGTGAQIDPATRVIVFHGSPKPHECGDALVQQFWRVSA